MRIGKHVTCVIFAWSVIGILHACIMNSLAIGACFLFNLLVIVYKYIFFLKGEQQKAKYFRTKCVGLKLITLNFYFFIFAEIEIS